MSRLDQLTSDIIEELGIDVYSGYDQERHLITEAVLISIASALIAEFLKGLINPKQLGLAARERINRLLKTFESKEGLGSVDAHAEINELVASVRSMEPPPNSEQLAQAETTVANSLERFGMKHYVALEHAKSIRSLVEVSISSDDAADA